MEGTQEQGQTEILKEVKMEEEQKVEEKAEVATIEPEATPEPTTEIPGAEISPELTEPTAEVAPELEGKPSEVETKEKLAAEVKAKLLACAEENDCIDALLGRFEQVASKLGIPTDKLIDQVFALLKGEKIES